MVSPDSDLHTTMLARGRAKRALWQRIRKAAQYLVRGDGIYGMEWGDPDVLPPLKHVRDNYLLPYLDPTKTVLEIGPGGGRWTRYMTTANTIYAVDHHRELLEELSRSVRSRRLRRIVNHGDDFPGVPDGSVDFVFSFGTFVHLDAAVIDRYLRNLKRVLAPGADVVIQYSDKTKPLGRQNRTFSDNDPERMRAQVTTHGYEILEEDTASLWHSAVMRFRLPQEGQMSSR